MLEINKKLISYNYTKGVTINPRYIVVHDTDNTDKGANADAHYRYFGGGDRGASAHYFVDDSNIIQILEDTWRGWHCGDRHNDTVNNGNSIGVETCVNSDGDYERALNNTIDLVKYLMEKWNIPIGNVVRHYDVTGKYCPRRILDNGTWDWFKKQLNGEVSNPPVVEKPQSNLDKAKNFIGGRCKELQEKLISAGYNCGGYGPDGIFGQGTYNSLIEFQKQHCSMVDGLAGEETFRELNNILSPKNNGDTWIRALQEACNDQGFSSQPVDGVPGDLTLEGCPTLKQGVQGEITRILQQILINRGYSCGNAGADGVFGEGTYKAVIAFQNGNRLDADGIVGQNTWRALLGL